jgi:hypothetical protein
MASGARDDAFALVGSGLLGGAALPPPAAWAQYIEGISMQVKVRAHGRNELVSF